MLHSVKNLGILLVGILLAAIPCGKPLAAENTLGEYSIKAVFIYNFAQFTQWPNATFAEDSTPLKITVFGDRSLIEDFALINGKTVDGHPVQVSFTRDPMSIPGCNILFVTGTDRNKWSQIFAALGDEPVLTIGELNGFLEFGGIINFHLADGRIRFQVNLDQARKHDLIISSRILALASKVINSGVGKP